MNALSFSTALCIATLLALIVGDYLPNRQVSFIFDEVTEEGRNERSTPRTFILPATPAVALIQEEKKALRGKRNIIQHCMLKLHDLGYDIYDFRDIYDVHLMIHLLHFQSNNGLPRTGKFDTATLAKLGCGF
jgi:hypothetical protein